MLDKLRQAAQAGEKFRDNLAQTSMFNTTKWLDGASSAVKPALFAMAVASGASSGAAVAEEANTQPPLSAYDNMVLEAQHLATLPRSELIEQLRQRPETQAFDNMKKISVRDLAEKIVDHERGNNWIKGHPLENAPMRLTNPFSSNQPIQVSLNTNEQGLDTVMEIMNETMPGLREALKSISNPIAGTADPEHAGVNSFSDPTMPGFVMITENMPRVGWASMNPDARAEEIAFTLFHELAHPHIAQKLIIHGGQGDNDSPKEANAKMYRTATEAHAHITAALATNKAFDLPPAVLQQRLADLQSIEDNNVQRAGLNGSPGFVYNNASYRGAKALEVLSEIAERDPDFLKSLTDEQIPFVAYDIVKTAGYHHNAADLILDTKINQIAPSINDAARSSDMRLMDTVRHLHRSNEVFQNARDDLDGIWKQKTQRGEYEALKAALDTRPAASSESNSEQIKQLGHALSHKADSFFTPPSVEQTIRAHLPESSGSRSTLDDNLEARLAALAVDVEHALDQLPDNETLDIRRADALTSVEGELRNLSAGAKSNDPSHVVAAGSGQTPEQIAGHIMSTYSGSFDQAHQQIADYEAAEQGDRLDLGM